MNVKGYTKPLLIVIGLLIAIGVLSFFQGDRNAPKNSMVVQIDSPAPQFQRTSDKTVDLAFDILQALSNYYVATQNELNEGSEIVDIMAALLNANKYLESGNVYMEKYLNDSNEVIQVTAQGMVKGANKVIQANNEFINFMRSDQVTDYEYASANYLSNQKEGYKFISIAAPQFTLLVFEPAKSENPSGKIPYTISETDRKRILKEIERLFGDNLRSYRADVKAKAGKYNAILFSVDAIYNNLVSETYEEAKKIQK